MEAITGHEEKNPPIFPDKSMLIFGWGRESVEYEGATVLQTCPRCGENSYWQLVERKLWATLFFISVFPYSKKYYLLCQKCSAGIELNEHQLAAAREMARLTSLLFRRGISEEEYAREIKMIEL